MPDNIERPLARFSPSTPQRQIEPLGGVTDVNELMTRFPSSVYQTGSNSRLYRFIETLCGDSGAGQIQKQSYLARLSTEGENLIFSELDSAYTSTFGFRRLPSETYTAATDIESLTPNEWADIVRKDNSFRNRMQDFFVSARFGGSPTGIGLAARAGAGVDCEVIEAYKAIQSADSDDPLSLEITNPSDNHFDVLPKVVSRTGNPDEDLTYDSDFYRNPDGDWVSEPQFNMLPHLERNIVGLVDRIRPVGTSFSVKTTIRRFLPHEASSTFASSTRFWPSRFVIGNTTVQWPPVDSSRGFWIVSGVENEAPRLAGAAWERPTIFHTVEGITSYSNEAFSEPTFNSAAFWDSSGSFAPADQYRSVHVGAFDPVFLQVYPIFQTVPPETVLEETLALAIPFTPIETVSRGLSS